MLDNIMLYRLPGNGASSARLYWGSLSRAAPSKRVELPAAVSIFPDDITMAPRPWAESLFPNIVHWNKVARGGHFGAFEQPDLFTEELRQAFRSLRPVVRNPSPRPPRAVRCARSKLRRLGRKPRYCTSTFPGSIATSPRGL